MRWPLALAAACLVASACGGSSTSPSGSTGTLRMMLTDSPFTDAKSLFITFSEVDTHKSDTAEGAWSKVEFPNGATRTCDLKKLQTAQDVLILHHLCLPLLRRHQGKVRWIKARDAKVLDCASQISGENARLGRALEI